MSTQKRLDTYERPQMEELFLFIEGSIATSARDTETIDDDSEEHGWSGNN